MKKILAIASYPYLPFFSGGQKLIARFFEYLGKVSNLSVICTTGNDRSLAENYTHLPFLKTSFTRYGDLRLIKKISTEIVEGGYDMVIWEHPYYAWLASIIKKRTGIPMILHTHNIEYQRFRSLGKWWWPILKVYERWSFKKADLIFFTSPEDRLFAINTWKVKAGNCVDLPYGIDCKTYPDDRLVCRELVQKKHAIQPSEYILFFNGLLDYRPNLDALKTILNDINPILLHSPGFRYKIIICGKKLPAELDLLKEYAEQNIIYAGFAEDISTYYKAADLFLNPVQTGGGIKTKMVESIGYGTTVVATVSGASGINREVCGNKLIVVGDNDWHAFSSAVVKYAKNNEATRREYYDHYYWGNVIKNILTSLPAQLAGNLVK